ncbi:MAG: MFS transporter [Chloroflexota bacterium]|nr:MFS transporter [Chloroflexota bacterium]
MSFAGPALLRNVDFRKLWASQAATVFGYFTILIAVPLLVFSRTHSAWQTGLVAAFETLAYPLIAPWAGVAADRMNRRVIMLTCDATRVVLYGSIPVAAAFGQVAILHVYIIAALAPLFTVLFDACALSALTALVRRDQLVEANARLQITVSVGALVGPSVAGVLITNIGEALSLMVACVTFACSFCALATIRRPFQRHTLGVAAGHSVRADLAEGLRFLWRQRTVRALAAVLFVFTLADGGVYGLLPVYALEGLGIRKALVGLLYAASGVGGIVSAFLVTRVSARLGIRTMMIGGFSLAGVLTVAMAFAPNLPAALVLLMLRAFCVEMVIITVISLRQRLIPDHLQGRVNIAARAISMSGFPLSSSIAGLGIDLIGVRPVYALMSLFIFIAALFGLLVPRRTDVERQVAAMLASQERDSVQSEPVAVG